MTWGNPHNLPRSNPVLIVLPSGYRKDLRSRIPVFYALMAALQTAAGKQARNRCESVGKATGLEEKLKLCFPLLWENMLLFSFLTLTGVIFKIIKQQHHHLLNITVSGLAWTLGGIQLNYSNSRMKWLECNCGHNLIIRTVTAKLIIHFIWDFFFLVSEGISHFAAPYWIHIVSGLNPCSKGVCVSLCSGCNRTSTSDKKWRGVGTGLRNARIWI